MKILFLTHRFYPDIGGIEVNSEILATAFSKAGHEVKLLTWTADSGEKTFPFTVIRHPTTSTLFKEHRWADVVFENNPCLRLAWPTIFFNKPSVVALRTWIRRIDGTKSWEDRLKFIWLQRASEIIAVSEAIRKTDWPMATVIGNPYRSNLFRILPDVSKIFDFVFFGRLVSDKGVALAIQAFHRIITTSTNKNLSFTIVGDGPEREVLKKMVNELHLNDQVRFTGALSGEPLVTCLNRHRFLLVPSLWEEPFGNVALEGMACGCVPIVSDGGGLPDAVGNAGLKFGRGEIDDFVACIYNILSSPDLEEQLRDAAKNHLAAHYPDVVAQRYLEIVKTAFTKAKKV